MDFPKIRMPKIRIEEITLPMIGGSLSVNAVTRTDEIKLSFSSDFNNDFR